MNKQQKQSVLYLYKPDLSLALSIPGWSQGSPFFPAPHTSQSLSAPVSTAPTPHVSALQLLVLLAKWQLLLPALSPSQLSILTIHFAEALSAASASFI